MRNSKHAVAAVLGLLAFVTPSAIWADVVTYSFTGTLATPIIGSTTVFGQFTLDTSGTGSITAFDFTAPLAEINAANNWSATVLTWVPAVSPNVDVVLLEFSRGFPQGLLLYFESDLSTFSSSSLLVGPITRTTSEGPSPGSEYIFNCFPAPCSGTLGGTPFGGALFSSGAVVATPEPSSLMLFGSGALGLLGMIRRKLRA
jgi:hypothetical protein